MDGCCKMTERSGCAGLPLFSKSELAVLFGLHRNTIIHRLRNIKPDAVHRGNGRYALPTVAVHLCPRAEVEQDLEALLAQRARGEH